MKLILILLLIGLSSNFVSAQDIILKLNGDEIKSKVIEISSETIKYKEFYFPEGPTMVIKTTEVFMIKYENGRKDLINEANNSVAIPRQKIPMEAVKKRDPYDGNYFMLGIGTGPSYGGVGIRSQFRFGGTTGFGIHAGIGTSPGAGPWEETAPFGGGDPESIHASAGIKFFPYKGIYINTQFGLFGKNYYYDYYYDYYGNGEFVGTEYVIYGPSLLTGVDMEWGDKIGFGFNAAIGVSFLIGGWNNEFVPVADLGFIIRF